MINEYISVIKYDLLYSFVIIFIGLILGWLMYEKIVLRKINLKDALFEKDNLAGWIEFVGSIILPMFYLASNVLSVQSSDNIYIDLSNCVYRVVLYLICLTILRLLSGQIVKCIADEDEHGKINLNNEIYSQGNLAAAYFSVAISVVFTNGISLINFSNLMELSSSILNVAMIFVFTVLVALVYILVLGSKFRLGKELFIDNNGAAGFAFLGLMLAVQIILRKIALSGVGFDYLHWILAGGLSLVLFLILTGIFKLLILKLLKVCFKSEVFEDNNMGVAFGLSGLYIGVAQVIMSFIN